MREFTVESSQRAAHIRVTATILGVAALATLLMLALAGCPSRQTISQLVGTLGNATAQIAVLENNTALADKIRTDTVAAKTAIDNWKNGTPAEQAVEALNLVVADLNLIPGTSPYAPLIVLAVATAESIIAILAPGQAKAQRAGGSRAPKTAGEFRKQWNAIAAQRGLTQATI